MKGTRENKMFICETIDRNYTSVNNNFYPNVHFCGAPKENNIVYEFISYIQNIISNDHTSESKFLGQFDRWAMKNVNDNKINLIDGIEIGTKTINEKQILIDDLMSNYYLDIYTHTYGILIPSNELLNRTKYEWFVRMSTKQVLESDTIIGNYLLLSIAPEDKQGILEPLEIKPKWVGFWKIPSDAPYYGLKPNYLGNNLNKLPYPQQ
jgi:hypothetical protein